MKVSKNVRIAGVILLFVAGATTVGHKELVKQDRPSVGPSSEVSLAQDQINDDARFTFTKDNIASWQKSPDGVSIALTEAGAKTLRAVTAKYLGQKIRLYIGSTKVSDGLRVNEPIASRHVEVTFKAEESAKIISELPSDKETEGD